MSIILGGLVERIMAGESDIVLNEKDYWELKIRLSEIYGEEAVRCNDISIMGVDIKCDGGDLVEVGDEDDGGYCRE